MDYKGYQLIWTGYRWIALLSGIIKAESYDLLAIMRQVDEVSMPEG